MVQRWLKIDWVKFALNKLKSTDPLNQDTTRYANGVDGYVIEMMMIMMCSRTLFYTLSFNVDYSRTFHELVVWIRSLVDLGIMTCATRSEELPLLLAAADFMHTVCG